MKLRYGTGEHEVELLGFDADAIHVRIDGRELAATLDPLADGGAILAFDSRRFRILGARRKGAITVAVGSSNYDFVSVEPGTRSGRRGLAAPEITAPMPGKVLRVMVKEGDAVTAGQTLVVLEAMKMETSLAAESAATVKRVLVSEGEMVDHGAVLVELSPAAPAGPSDSQGEREAR